MHWHQLDHMQTICTSFQTDNHTNTSSLKSNVTKVHKIIITKLDAWQWLHEQHLQENNKLLKYSESLETQTFVANH